MAALSKKARKPAVSTGDLPWSPMMLSCKRTPKVGGDENRPRKAWKKKSKDMFAFLALDSSCMFSKHVWSHCN